MAGGDSVISPGRTPNYGTNPQVRPGIDASRTETPDHTESIRVKDLETGEEREYWVTPAGKREWDGWGEDERRGAWGRTDKNPFWPWEENYWVSPSKEGAHTLPQPAPAPGGSESSALRSNRQNAHVFFDRVLMGDALAMRTAMRASRRWHDVQVRLGATDFMSRSQRLPGGYLAITVIPMFGMVERPSARSSRRDDFARMQMGGPGALDRERIARMTTPAPAASRPFGTGTSAAAKAIAGALASNRAETAKLIKESRGASAEEIAKLLSEAAASSKATTKELLEESRAAKIDTLAKLFAESRGANKSEVAKIVSESLFAHGAETKAMLSEAVRQLSTAVAESRGAKIEDIARALGELLSANRAETTKAIEGSLAAKTAEITRLFGADRAETAKLFDQSLGRALETNRAETAKMFQGSRGASLAEIAKLLGDVLSANRAETARAFDESLATKTAEIGRLFGASGLETAKRIEDAVGQSTAKIVDVVTASASRGVTADQLTKVLSETLAKERLEAAKSFDTSLGAKTSELARLFGESRTETASLIQEALAANKAEIVKVISESRGPRSDEIAKIVSDAIAKDREVTAKAFSDALAANRADIAKMLSETVAAVAEVTKQACEEHAPAPAQDPVAMAHAIAQVLDPTTAEESVEEAAPSESKALVTDPERAIEEPLSEKPSAPSMLQEIAACESSPEHVEEEPIAKEVLEAELATEPVLEAALPLEPVAKEVVETEVPIIKIPLWDEKVLLPEKLVVPTPSLEPVTKPVVLANPALTPAPIIVAPEIQRLIGGVRDVRLMQPVTSPTVSSTSPTTSASAALLASRLLG